MKLESKYFSVSILLLMTSVLFVGCRPEVPIQKPRGYFRVEMPKKEYQAFDREDFPYQFKYPTYATITKDSNLVKDVNNPYWINVYVPEFDATIYLSYKTAADSKAMEQLINESFKMSYLHDVKADYIDNPEFTTSNGYKGVLYNVGGDAASTYQFYLSDTKTRFIRGSLYFNVPPNADSLAPMIKFMKVDLDTMISSFRFK